MNLPADTRATLERLMTLAGDKGAFAGEKANALDTATATLAEHGATWADVIALIPVRREHREQLWEVAARMDRENLARWEDQ